MRERDVFLAIEEMDPINDKLMRARPFQARLRSGMVEFDMDAPWWPTLKHEMLTFPGTYVDQVDALAWLGHYLAKMADAPTQHELDEAEWEYEQEWSQYGYALTETNEDHQDDTTGY